MITNTKQSNQIHINKIFYLIEHRWSDDENRYILILKIFRIGFFLAKKKFDWIKHNNKGFKFIDKNDAIVELVD